MCINVPVVSLYDTPLPLGIQVLIVMLCAALEVVNHRVGMRRRRNNNNYHSKKLRSVGQAVQKDPRTAKSDQLRDQPLHNPARPRRRCKR